MFFIQEIRRASKDNAEKLHREYLDRLAVNVMTAVSNGAFAVTIKDPLQDSVKRILEEDGFKVSIIYGNKFRPEVATGSIISW